MIIFSVTFYTAVWLTASLLEAAPRLKALPVEPPASFVFLGTVSLVVVVVLVIGAELHVLVAGPF